MLILSARLIISDTRSRPHRAGGRAAQPSTVWQRISTGFFGGGFTRRHSAAEPQPKNDRIMAGQNDREMNEGKQERDPVLISQKVTKKTGKLNFAENDEFWDIALRRARRSEG